MDAFPPDEHILSDLALLYIALAHGTDQDLNGTEMDVIARRLQDIQAGVGQGTVLSAIKVALEWYTQDDVHARIQEAIGHLRDAVPTGLRARIIKDLTDIGKADDAFLYEEASFIGELTDAWKHEGERTEASSGEAAPADTWSLFEAEYGGKGWTPVHDLTLIYVALAHRTDGVLHRREVEAILKKIGEWVPGAGPETLRAILQEAMQVYEEEPEGRSFPDAVDAIKTAVPEHQRAAVLSDLKYIAQADGVVLVEERVMIEKLARAWEMTE